MREILHNFKMRLNTKSFFEFLTDKEKRKREERREKGDLWVIGLDPGSSI